MTENGHNRVTIKIKGVFAMGNMLGEFGMKMLNKHQIQEELYADFKKLIPGLKVSLDEKAIQEFAGKCSAALLVAALHSLSWYEDVDRLWRIFLDHLDGHYPELQTFYPSVLDETVQKCIFRWYQEALEGSPITKSRTTAFGAGIFTAYASCPEAFETELGRYVSPLVN